MASKFCPECGNQMAPDSRFCGSCGNSVVPEDATGGCPNCSSDVVGDGQFCRTCGQLLIGPRGIKVAGLGRRVGAYLLEIALVVLTLIVGYIIWWLFTLSRGQTPGKQLLGIRVMRTDGTRSDWGWTFIREFIIKLVVIRILDSFLVIVGIIDLLWAFWDKDRQTLHDKVMKTIVVDDREFRLAALAEPADTL